MGLGNNTPRFNKKEARIRFTLAKYYGLGSDNESWEVAEIADYLNVEEDTVYDYLQSEMAEDMKAMFRERLAEMRMEVAERLMRKLDRLDELKDELRQEKRPAVTSHNVETVQGDNVEIDIDGISVDEANVGDIDVPVPNRYREVTEIGNLKDIWDEERRTIEQIEDLLGLEEPDQLEAEVEGTVEQKVFQLNSGDDGLPDQEVEEQGESERDQLDAMDALPEDMSIEHLGGMVTGFYGGR